MRTTPLLVVLALAACTSEGPGIDAGADGGGSGIAGGGSASVGGGAAGGSEASGGGTTVPELPAQVGQADSGFARIDTLQVGSNTDLFLGVAARSDSEVWAVSSGGTVWVWNGTSVRAVLGDAGPLDQVEPHPSGVVVATSSSGVAWCSGACATDAGRWSRFAPPVNKAISGLCTSSAGVWFVGSDQSDPELLMASAWRLSLDGGVSVAPFNEADVGPLSDCVERPDGTLVASGQGGVLFRTSDGGLSVSRPPGGDPEATDQDVWSAIALLRGQLFVVGNDYRLARFGSDGGWDLLVSRPFGASGPSWSGLLATPGNSTDVELYGKKISPNSGRLTWSPQTTTLWPDPVALDVVGVSGTDTAVYWVGLESVATAQARPVFQRAVRK